MTSLQDADTGEAADEGWAAPTPQGAADYIAEMTTELAKLARQARLETLAYLLDVAQLEATTTVKPPRSVRRAS